MKTVIITGSTGNLGMAMVRKFVDEGYRVVGTVTRKRGGIDNYPEGSFEEAVVDVSNSEEAKAFVENTISKYVHIDAAILTVGGFAEGTVAETGITTINEQYKLNFETAYNIAQPVFTQMMKQKKGHIFFTGSRPGLDAKSSKGMVAYGLAKSLLFRLAELMNDEGAKYNVVTSIVVPSTIDTPTNRKFMPEADFDNWVTPKSIADLVFFYCTDAADSVREPILKVYNNS